MYVVRDRASPFVVLFLAFVARHKRPVTFTRVDLTRTVNLGCGVFYQFTVLSNPAWQATHGEQHGEEVRGESHRTVDQAGVEVHVGVQPAADKVVVCQRDFFQVESQFKQGVPTKLFQHLVSRTPGSLFFTRFIKSVASPP